MPTSLAPIVLTLTLPAIITPPTAAEPLVILDAAIVAIDPPAPDSLPGLTFLGVSTTPNDATSDWSIRLEPSTDYTVTAWSSYSPNEPSERLAIQQTFTTPMRGDFNGDGAVTAADLSIVLDGFDDGTHTASDLSAVLDHFGDDD